MGGGEGGRGWVGGGARGGVTVQGKGEVGVEVRSSGGILEGGGSRVVEELGGTARCVCERAGRNGRGRGGGRAGWRLGEEGVKTTEERWNTAGREGGAIGKVER
ncbi:hypothetical protein Tco_0733962 [Tanacetum coccineum]|uniref:Uncharacterized protein n=1 Tax=Tanacetum coccineum TaxID=301880 RepID=A0ABQ5G937_9ASTR